MQRGFTLIELMVTIAIATILLTLAIPAFTNMLDKNQLKGAADAFYADLQFIRAEAIKRNQQVSLTVTRTSNTDWCYGIATIPDCDCTGTDATKPCAIDTVPKVVRSTDFRDVKLLDGVFGGVANNAITFDPLRGIRVTATTETATLESRKGKQVTATITPLGSVSLCSPSDADKNIHDYQVC